MESGVYLKRRVIPVMAGGDPNSVCSRLPISIVGCYPEDDDQGSNPRPSGHVPMQILVSKHLYSVLSWYLRRAQVCNHTQLPCNFPNPQLSNTLPFLALLTQSRSLVSSHTMLYPIVSYHFIHSHIVSYRCTFDFSA